jgi:hypothetical protein
MVFKLLIEEDYFFFLFSENHQIKNIMHASTSALLSGIDGPKVITQITIIIVHFYNNTPPTQQILVLP